MYLIKKTSLVLLCGALLSQLAHATEPTSPRWLFSPALNYVMADSDRLSDDDTAFDISLLYRNNPTWGYALSYSIDNLDRKPKLQYRQKALAANAMLFFSRRHLDPYLLAGVGVMRTTLFSTETNPLLQIGAGLLAPLNRAGAGLRAELRYRIDFDGNSRPGQRRFNDLVANLGLILPLSSHAKDKAPNDSDHDGIADGLDHCPATPAGTPVTHQGCPVEVEDDTDHDGINDTMDRCPNSPQGSAVNDQGCGPDSDHDGIKDSQDDCPNSSVGSAVNQQGCPLDSDADGIPDERDQCPDSAEGIQVDAIGCERDDDGDGIKNSLDACPQTSPGKEIDRHGCALPEIITLEGVYFETNSAALTPDSDTRLNQAVATLKRHPDLHVRIEGHTDNQGSAAYNQKLSAHRAQRVRQYFTDHGVAADRLSSLGMGSSRPIASNEHASGRQKNRRVELHVVK